MGFARGELPQTLWRINGRAIHLAGVFFSNDVGVLGTAAAGGALVSVLDHLNVGADNIAIVYPERELLPPQARLRRGDDGLAPASAPMTDNSRPFGVSSRLRRLLNFQILSLVAP